MKNGKLFNEALQFLKEHKDTKDWVLGCEKDYMMDIPCMAASAMADFSVRGETDNVINRAFIKNTSFDWRTHGDFKKYYDTNQKRNIWILGYFGGGSVNIVDAFVLATQYASDVNV